MDLIRKQRLQKQRPSGKRIITPRTPRSANNNELINALEQQLRIAKIQIDALTIERDALILEKTDILTALSSELEFNNEIEGKFENLLKRTISEEVEIERRAVVKRKDINYRMPKQIPRKTSRRAITSRNGLIKPPKLKMKKVGFKDDKKPSGNMR